MKRTLATIALAAMPVIGLVGCSSSSQSSDSPTPSASSSATSGYTDAEEQVFIAGVKSSLGSTATPEQAAAIASCSWRGITATISHSEYVAYEANPTSQEVATVKSRASEVGQRCSANPLAF